MNAWSGEDGDVMGPTVTRETSAKETTPPLKNGSDLRESGYLIAVGSRTARFRRKHKSKMLVVILLVLLLMLLCLAVVMTVLYVRQKRHKPIRICETKECLRSAANLALSMDKTVDPCDDFYQYACGNWAREHPRPDAYRSYDWFREKQTKVYAAVRDFLAANVTSHCTPVQQAKDMYAACMDSDALDKRGVKPVLSILNHLGLPPFPSYINATDLDYDNYTFNWLETVIKVKTILGMDVLIGFDIFTDPKNSTLYRLVMGSPETTNPFPSLYDKKRHAGRKDKRTARISKQLSGYSKLILNKQSNANEKKSSSDDEDKIAQIHKLFYAELMKIFVIESGGAKNSKLAEIELDQHIIIAANDYYSTSDDIYELEADNSTDVDDDIYLKIPEYTVEEVQSHTDMIVESNNGTVQPIWKRYLEGVFNISDVRLDFEKDKILISDPDLKYMALLATYISKTPPVIIELYIWIKVVEVMAIHTTTELRSLFQRASEQLHSHEASNPPRSLQCASAVNDMLGMAVAYAIMDPHFLNVTKPKIQTMLHEMKNALAHLVGKAKWMDDNTKVATYQKIIQMKTLIGFPEWMMESGKLEEYYDGIEINTGTHLDNMINIIQVKIKKALNRFRDGNNFTWATDPTEVNAYHTFQENTINDLISKVSHGSYKCYKISDVTCVWFVLDAAVPLVMLQHPFFELGLDSLNYGSLGTVLGHEITHGFDNFGRKFDKNGNMLPWWSNETVDSFINMTHCFVDQYSAYYVEELDQHVDGKKTLGENIADNGGVREALAALKEHLRKRGSEPKLPGFEHMTSEQLFFLSYGNLWCGVSTKDSLEGDLEDEHAPQQFRARGALQNNEGFARAWRCPSGSTMNPAKRCVIF